MSDVMLQGVLCMPPELWRDDPLDVYQRYQRYLQASRRIEDDGREIERMRAALASGCNMSTPGWSIASRTSCTASTHRAGAQASSQPLLSMDPLDDLQ